MILGARGTELHQQLLGGRGPSRRFALDAPTPVAAARASLPMRLRLVTLGPRSWNSPTLPRMPYPQHPSRCKSQYLPIKGGPPALPGWQQKFDIYSGRPPMLSTVSKRALGRKFHEGRAAKSEQYEAREQSPLDGFHSRVLQIDTFAGDSKCRLGIVR